MTDQATAEADTTEADTTEADETAETAAAGAAETAEPPTTGGEPAPGGRRRWPDALIAGVLVLGAAGMCLAMVSSWRKVLWSDEVWRAYAASRPGVHFWTDLHDAAGPSALGWLAATRLAGTVLGWHGWALRSVELAAVTLLGGATYLLARRFLGRAAATVCGLLVVFNQELFYQGIQLKPYAVEMLVTVAILGLWVTAPASAAGPGATRSRLLRFAAVAVVSLLMLPAAFVVGPLAVADTLSGRGLRGRLRAGLETLVAVVPVAAHTLFFVGAQGDLRTSRFWNSNFLSGRSPGDALRFFLHESGRMTQYMPPGIRLGPVALTGPAGDRLSVAIWVLPFLVLAFWLLGAVALLRTRPGRLLVATAFGANLLMLVASAARAWPFGAVRTNVFLVPPLVIIGAAGVVEAVRLVRRRLPGRAGFVTAAVPVVALVTLLAVAVSASMLFSWNRRSGPRYGDQMTDITLAIRRVMHPGDMAVVASGMAHYNFRYAMEVSDDGPADAPTLPRMPEPDIVLVKLPGDGTAAAGIAAHQPRPDQVFLVMSLGSSGATYGALVHELRVAGYCPVRRTSYRTTGLLTVLGRCPAPARPAATG